MVGYSTLRKIISANPLRAITAADLQLCVCALAPKPVFSCAEASNRACNNDIARRSVLVLRAFVLTLDDNSRLGYV